MWGLGSKGDGIIPRNARAGGCQACYVGEEGDNGDFGFKVRSGKTRAFSFVVASPSIPGSSPP